MIKFFVILFSLLLIGCGSSDDDSNHLNLSKELAVIFENGDLVFINLESKKEINKTPGFQKVTNPLIVGHGGNYSVYDYYKQGEYVLDLVSNSKYWSDSSKGTIKLDDDFFIYFDVIGIYKNLTLRKKNENKRIDQITSNSIPTARVSSSLISWYSVGEEMLIYYDFKSGIFDRVETIGCRDSLYLDEKILCLTHQGELANYSKDGNFISKIKALDGGYSILNYSSNSEYIFLQKISLGLNLVEYLDIYSINIKSGELNLVYENIATNAKGVSIIRR